MTEEKKGSGCGKVPTIYLNHTQRFLQSSLPLPLSSSPSPPMDGVALSQSGGAAHKDKRVAVSVCCRRNSQLDRQRFKNIFFERSFAAVDSGSDLPQRHSCITPNAQQLPPPEEEDSQAGGLYILDFQHGEPCEQHPNFTLNSPWQSSLWAGEWN